MDEIMINETQECMPDYTAESGAERIYIAEDERASARSDDVMMTQGILCIILLLALVVLKFINSDFLSDLLAMYNEKISLPPEGVLADMIESAEQWFRK